MVSSFITQQSTSVLCREDDVLVSKNTVRRGYMHLHICRLNKGVSNLDAVRTQMFWVFPDEYHSNAAR